MGESYLASLLLTGGVCLGFAMHALMLARHLRQRAYVCLTFLSLLEAFYCICSYGLYREVRPTAAMNWMMVSSESLACESLRMSETP